MEFSCSARQVAGRLVLTVTGDVDLAVHTRFEAEVEKSWDGSADLVIDCSLVTFMDSMGIRVLVQTMQRAAENGSDFALAAPSEPVLRVLDLAGVKSLFPVVGPIADPAPDSAP
jgi:stage II sporulation protein AA (anti-sigma F factor antagonist)